MRYLGLDLGARSLGIAISDKTRMIASFYKNISYNGNYECLIDIICEIVKKEDIAKIVLGWPKNMNNTVGERGQKTLEFKNMLEQILACEVVLEDERLTTKLAESVLIDADLSRKKRKKVVDGVSAIIILQSYLDRRKEA
ncbi:MAG TPA: Holliday junction resolvase RuvX [Bacilli bacterium]|nr:Holliday junction resolvase RuvX [Bacilli bacterium]